MTENHNQDNIYSANQPPANASGQGSSAPVPKEIKGWNWGAFLLSWIWGIFHGVWLSLLVFIPYVGFVMAIILGIKGNEWSWQAQHYDSIEEFRKRERKWAIAGLIVIISITIIALLASMILVGMGGARQKARDSRRIADLHNVQNALELYFAKNGEYPTGITSWDGTSGLVDTLTGAGVGVSQVPKDPLNDATRYYRYGGTATDYVLGAVLEQSDVALNDDIDGTVNSIDCTDPVYCIRP